MNAAAGDAYDVIVLGAGPIGQTVADRTCAAGLSVAVVERELVGGECSYWACIPSKAMLRPVVAVADAERVEGARQAISGPIDASAVFKRRDGYVTDWHDDGQADGVRSMGATLVRGQGRLDGPRRVAVERPEGAPVVLTARHAVAICTGRGPTGRLPTGMSCPGGWPSSAAAGSRWKWPAPGRAWAPGSPCWPMAMGCCPGWNRSLVR